MKWGISLKQLVVLQMSSAYLSRGDRWKPSPPVGCCGAGDCHRQTGRRRPGYRAVQNSMARLRLDITPRITWAGFALHF